MGAPSTAYHTTKLYHQKNGVVTAFDKAFFGDLTLHQIKDRFYLDYVFELNVGDVKLFIGGCEVDSYNYKMHKAERFGPLLVYEGKAYVLLKDAGLNTKAYIGTGIGAKLSYPAVASVLLKSAYYLSTVQAFEIKTNGGTAVNFSLPNVAAAATYNENITIPGEVGDLIEIRGKAINDEGTTYSAWQSAYIRPSFYFFKYARVDNGDGSVTFTVSLFPIAFEVNLSVVFKQAYVGSGSFTYCTVTVLAGNTTGTNTMALAGTALSYEVQSWTPPQLSDLTEIQNQGELAPKWRIKLRLQQEFENEYFLYITIMDDAGDTAILPIAVELSIYISGTTETGAYGEAFTFEDIIESDERSLILTYESGDTLTDISLSATASPPSVDGKEIVFTYET